MKITLLAFGIVKDIFKAPQLEIDCEVADAGALKQMLADKYPELKKLAHYMVAVNNEYATDTTAIKEGDEIAIIPPVSGG
ncbi:MAG: molybdopterin converting factor subunit 1 [Bacteroidetes bacterium]|nr:molybdopterin converting factor subunit 1 [Bacteroidota bacterium]